MRYFLWLFGLLVALAVRAGAQTLTIQGPPNKGWDSYSNASGGSFGNTAGCGASLCMTYSPDMHTPFICPQTTGLKGTCYWWIAAHQEADNYTGSTTVVSTAGSVGSILKFSIAGFGDGHTSAQPVLIPSCHAEGPGGVQPTGCELNLDADYLGADGAFIASDGTIVLISHAETRSFGTNINHNGTPGYAVVAGSELPPGPGGSPRPTASPAASPTPLIVPPDAVPTSVPKSGANGYFEPGVLVDQNGNVDVALADFPVNCCGYPRAGQGSRITMAQAPLSGFGNGTYGTFHLLVNGAFTGAAITSPATGDDIFAGGYGTCQGPRQPFLTYSTTSGVYLMVVLCGGSVPGWYWSESGNLKSWSPLQLAFPTSPFGNFGPCQPTYENFTFYTPGNNDASAIGANGNVMFAYTACWSGNPAPYLSQPHAYYSMGFTFK